MTPTSPNNELIQWIKNRLAQCLPMDRDIRQKLVELIQKLEAEN